jgi:hypothetical protein
MNIKEKLMNIQAELKAPKDLDNNFGKYKYRSAESILEALKPLLKKNEVILNLTDGILQIGERYYIEATAILSDTKEEGVISVKAYAREEEIKKGMDSSQVTGAASSYARKYALNGLFAIDDNKDSDYTNDEPKAEKPTSKPPQQKPEAGKPQQAVTAKKEEAAVKPNPFVTPHHICEDCQKEITDHKNSKGVIYSVADIIQGSTAEYNKKLCYACASKRFKARQAELRQQAKKAD